MQMTQEEFLDNVARLVAGLQAPVSMMPRECFGAAYEPWSKLLEEANGGFGWTNAEKCRDAFTKILDGAKTAPEREAIARSVFDEPCPVHPDAPGDH